MSTEGVGAEPTARSPQPGMLGGITRRQLWVIADVAAVAGGLALNWGWLIAVGAAPLLIGVLPCAAMCALGFCMAGRRQGASSADGRGDRRPSAHTENAPLWWRPTGIRKPDHGPSPQQRRQIMRNYGKPLVLAFALFGATNLALAQDVAPEEGTPPMMQNDGTMDQGDMSGMMGMMQMMQRCNEMMAAMTEQLNAPKAPETQDDNG